jgi:pimeloyl-ACP methyl ester carboxylesterase
MNRLRLSFFLIFAALSSNSTPAFADGLIKIDTRPGVTLGYWYMPRPNAMATVVLLPGGAGGIGLKNGVVTSNNFLVRSRNDFAAQRFNVAVVGRPSDKEDLDPVFRVGAAHMEDMRKLVTHLKKETGLPVWLIGTSRGTLSAAAAAIDFGNDQLAGIVLTSSITRRTQAPGVPDLALERIRIPVLVVHHQRDACSFCRPQDVMYITRGLVNAPVKKQIMVNTGDGATGDPCDALHWHGFIGAERQTVDTIAEWIKNPAP